MNDGMRVFLVAFTCGMIGILMAAVFFILNTQGIIVDEYIVGSSTSSIADVMAMTVIFWAALGGLLAAIVSRG